MRILTVRQPWAWAIIHGGKDIENRSRNIAGGYRGLVAIHVARTEDANAFSLSETMAPLNASADVWIAALTKRDRERVHSMPWHDSLGSIIGVVDLVDAHHETDRTRCAIADLAHAIDGEWEHPCSSWAEPGVWHLVLKKPRPLAVPIPYRGGLGLRRLDDATAARVRGGLA